MNLSIKTLSKRWSISVRQVQSLVAAGMPTTSEKAALRWRRFRANGQRINTKSVKRRSDPQAPDADERLILDLPPDEADLERAAQTLIGKEQSVSLVGILDRTQRAERIAFAALEHAERNGAHEEYKSIVHAHSVAAIAAMKATRDLQAILEARGALLTLEQAKTVYLPYLHRARAAAAAMPATCGARCNPSDPVLSRHILQEWVDSVFLRTVREPAVGC